MSDVLDRIAAYKREDVAARKAAISQDAIEARAKEASPPRGFRAALARRFAETGRPAVSDLRVGPGGPPADSFAILAPVTTDGRVTHLLEARLTPGLLVQALRREALPEGWIGAVVDGRGWKRWAFPLIVVGLNPIALYCLWQLSSGFIRQQFRVHLGQDVFATLGELWVPALERGSVLLILWLVVWWMYRRKIFLRI